ncbi:hypothetical protein [Candidatus Endoriftia persephonae]|jgi:hypothetical protein|uniref:HicA protein n=4 Tax=Gammaproteobacteria TaxID=1236 RepID=G2FJ14_9GAMM|nr:hypothetical protein [Candidatus Endoriftia persephone]EGV50787.1 hypothetical protein Rifp1Sym_cj00110 [endosymbiont of Riftia pachyptila (vent Ph05)]EGW53216.1 hypothetical protein TevJSym_bi00200 [endosymbiont of Tevnia jerichonana (vent Tica)]KRT54339.1 hypothetical protein Ga0074115_104100 [endosymbiont of Ridgeia piscesae]KRT57280.1 hypothetical protein Ga0076813_113010 [endosymbiont of Ridgeia piscesae]USF87149.1 type II toxin-antitoxin system HicA family toxin [Candidatus Endoriftia
MNHKQQHTLAAIFHDPVSANIHWREIESLLKAAGAELEESHGARLRVLLNGLEETLHRPHHSAALTKESVRNLRKFLSAAGVTPHTH